LVVGAVKEAKLGVTSEDSAVEGDLGDVRLERDPDHGLGFGQITLFLAGLVRGRIEPIGAFDWRGKKQSRQDGAKSSVHFHSLWIGPQSTLLG
jgi:hypothetical protein